LAGAIQLNGSDFFGSIASLGFAVGPIWTPLEAAVFRNSRAGFATTRCPRQTIRVHVKIVPSKVLNILVLPLYGLSSRAGCLLREQAFVFGVLTCKELPDLLPQKKTKQAPRPRSVYRIVRFSRWGREIAYQLSDESLDFESLESLSLVSLASLSLTSFPLESFESFESSEDFESLELTMIWPSGPIVTDLVGPLVFCIVSYAWHRHQGCALAARTVRA